MCRMSQTLHCRNVVGDQLLQVTPRGVRLVACEQGALVAEWAPPNGSMSVVAANATQVLAVVGGSRLVLLQVGPGALSEVASTQLGFEVTCLDVSPLQGRQHWAPIVFLSLPIVVGSV